MLDNISDFDSLYILGAKIFSHFFQLGNQQNLLSVVY